MLYLSSKLRESFLREASHTFFIERIMTKIPKLQFYIEIWRRKIGSLSFLTMCKLVPRGHKPLLVFSLSTFFQRNSSSILYDARQKKQKILLTFFHNLVENKTFQGLNKMVEVLWFVYVMK